MVLPGRHAQVPEGDNMIHLVQTFRGTGKTEAMIQWALEHPFHRTIVCYSQMEAKRVMARLTALHSERSNIPLPSHVVVGPDPSRLRGLHKEIGIDNADEVLASIFGDVKIASWTVPGKPFVEVDPNQLALF